MVFCNLHKINKKRRNKFFGTPSKIPIIHLSNLDKNITFSPSVLLRQKRPLKHVTIAKKFQGLQPSCILTQNQ